MKSAHIFRITLATVATGVLLSACSKGGGGGGTTAVAPGYNGAGYNNGNGYANNSNGYFVANEQLAQQIRGVYRQYEGTYSEETFIIQEQVVGLMMSPQGLGALNNSYQNLQAFYQQNQNHWGQDAASYNLDQYMTNEYRVNAAILQVIGQTLIFLRAQPLIINVENRTPFIPLEDCRYAWIQVVQFRFQARFPELFPRVVAFFDLRFHRPEPPRIRPIIFENMDGEARRKIDERARENGKKLIARDLIDHPEHLHPEVKRENERANDNRSRVDQPREKAPAPRVDKDKKKDKKATDEEKTQDGDKKPAVKRQIRRGDDSRTNTTSGNGGDRSATNKALSVNKGRTSTTTPDRGATPDDDQTPARD